METSALGGLNGTDSRQRHEEALLSIEMSREFDRHPYADFVEQRFGAYTRWLEEHGIPILNGSYVANARTAELGAWEWKGGNGALIAFSDQRVCDGYICEIPSGASLRPLRQLYEEIVFVLDGRGSTTVWHEGVGSHSFEWSRGSLFAVPLNAWHQHYNASGTEPVRYLALTSAPPMFDLFRDPSFIFGSDHRFDDRLDLADPGFYQGDGQYLSDVYGGLLDANFVSDVANVKLVPREKRGTGNRNMYIHLAGSTMFAHLSEFPVGTYKRAHRHGPGSHIVVLESEGYTLMWRDGEEPVRYDWQEGSVLSPPAGYWHQHYNTGRTPCRYLALHASIIIEPEDDGVDELEHGPLSDRLREEYVRECAAKGVPVADA